MMLVMKTLMVMVLFLVASANAGFGKNCSGTSRSRRCTTARIDEIGASTEKQKAMAVKKARALAKTIKVKKIELPENAQYLGVRVKAETRIETLCGYELGDVVKLSRKSVMDADGNIIVTEKLPKPFRKCTHVKLKYSALNHALYSITLYSEADKEMDEDVAWREVETMVALLDKRFSSKISSWWRNKPALLCKSSVGFYTGQSFCVEASRDAVVKRGALIGTQKARREDGWKFSLTLLDKVIGNVRLDRPQPLELDDSADVL